MGKRFIRLITGPAATAVILAAIVAGPTVAGNLITGAQIAIETITGANVKDGSLSGADMADGSLTGVDVADGGITGTDIANGMVTGTDLADGSLTGIDVYDNSLSGADINEGSLGQVPSAADATRLGGYLANSYLKTKDPLVRVAFYRFVTAYADGADWDGCRTWTRTGLPVGAMIMGFSEDPGAGAVNTIVGGDGKAYLRACNNQTFPNDGKAHLVATPDITWYVFLP